MNENDLAKQKAELLRQLDEEPPFNREEFEAKIAEGIGHEWAELQHDGSIAISITQWLPGGARGHGNSVVIPSESDYATIRMAHGLEKAGDSSTVIKKYVDGKWVIQADASKE